MDYKSKGALILAAVTTAAGLTLGHGGSGVHVPAPSDIIKPTQAPASLFLAQVLPYYGQKAPAWCAEDMACWIGSEADGRTSAQIMRDMSCDLIMSSWVYTEQDGGEPSDFDQCVDDGTPENTGEGEG